MTDSITTGDTCKVTHDVMVRDRFAFKKGDRVIIEGIEPNQRMPEYKYIVSSELMSRRYQLSDADLVKVKSPPPIVFAQF